MPHTYTNFLFHIVFSTKERFPFIKNESKARFYDYIGGTIRGLGGICLEIGGVEDHIHLLVKLKPTLDVPKFLQQLKPNTTKFARENLYPKFEWQTVTAVLRSANRRSKPSGVIFKVRKSITKT